MDMFPCASYPSEVSRLECWFSFCISGAGFVLEYYLPIWLQAIKARSVISSGVDFLPVVSAAILFTLAWGFPVMIVGYYDPFMFVASSLLSLGIDLLTTSSPTSPIGAVSRFQVPARVTATNHPSSSDSSTSRRYPHWNFIYGSLANLRRRHIVIRLWDKIFELLVLERGTGYPRNGPVHCFERRCDQPARVDFTSTSRHIPISVQQSYCEDMVSLASTNLLVPL
ncbi:uncharacterized protein A1O9_08413, partial [Exophiala aquamarina CBS 119918]